MIARIGVRRLIVAAAALALAIWVLGFATRGLLSGDSGVKLAQAHSLWESGFSTRALLDDRDLDPKLKFAPYGDFVRRVDGRRQGIYSITFTAATALLIGPFGLTGTLLLALAGGIGLLFAVDLLAGRMGLSPPARVGAALVTVGLTPILLYAAQLAEHTPAIALTTLALAYVATDRAPRPLLAGALVGLAATLRAECYLCCATVGIALVARPGADLRQRVHEGALYIAAALAVLVPFWALNLALSHTWDPVVTFQKAAPDRWKNVLVMLVGDLKGGPPGAWLVILIGAAVAALAPPTRADTPLRIALGVALVWLAWQLRAHATGRTLRGMFTLSPIAAYGLVATVWRPRWRAVWVFAVLTTLAIVGLNKSNDAGGLQLGARLLFPALPALVALAAAAVDDDARHRRWLALPAPAVLVALTAWMLHRGFPPAYEIAAKSGRASAAVARARPKIVVTRLWWESQVLTPALLDDKELLLISGKDLRPVLQLLADHGVDRVLVVNKGPVDVPLNGYEAHDDGPPVTAWIEFHEVAITPRTAPSPRPAPAAP